jgi:hypothetical protein
MSREIFTVDGTARCGQLLLFSEGATTRADESKERLFVRSIIGLVAYLVFEVFFTTTSIKRTVRTTQLIPLQR